MAAKTDTTQDDAGAERISDAEHAVMEALWKRSPQTAAEVCERVCKDRDWSIPTVKTLLSRLVAEGRAGNPSPTAAVSSIPR